MYVLKKDFLSRELVLDDLQEDSLQDTISQ